MQIIQLLQIIKVMINFTVVKIYTICKNYRKNVIGRVRVFMQMCKLVERW